MSLESPALPDSNRSSELFPAIRIEASQLGGRLGFLGRGRAALARAMLIPLVFNALFGVWLPLAKGRDFLDPVILGSYACLGVIFAAPVAAVRFADYRALRFAALLARILVSFAYGLAMSGPMLVLGIICVYSTRRIFVGPDLISLAECFLFGLALSLAVTAAVTWTTLSFSASAGKGVARGTFMGLLLAFFEWSRWLPDVALLGTAIAAVVATGFLLLLKRQSSGGEPAAPI